VITTKIAATLLGVIVAVSGCGPTGLTVITGEDYAPQYDYSEFYAVADRKPFTVFVWGNPFPGLGDGEMRQRLLPVMQANGPQARLTFTYAEPVEQPRPFYRLVLVFDPALNLTAASVCANQVRRQPEPSGKFAVFAIYCRNDLALSQASAATLASSPEDPAVGALFRQLFAVLFAQRYPEREHRTPFAIIRR
jgi:hypothetical protein